MLPKKPENSFWSDEQWAAIQEKGRSILVNAGAGSGKTAVLTERIVRILKDGIGLDRLVVLTFTKAAAGEMKERLRKKLEKEIEAGWDLREALEFLDQAAVQTFDSFALSLVRRYHYRLGVEKSLAIGDGVLFSLKKKEIIEDVFRRLYEEGDPEFLDFVSLFAVKDDRTLQKYVFEVDNRLELLLDRKGYLDNYLERFYRKDFIRKMIGRYGELLSLERSRIADRLNRLRDLLTDWDLLAHVEDCEAALSPLFSAQTYEEFRAAVDVALPRTPRGGDEIEKIRLGYEKDKIRDSLKKLNDYLDYESEEEMLETVLSTRKHAAVLIRILNLVHNEFMEYKRKTNLYEFQDIAKMAIRLLEENEDIRNQLREHIYEILIDEYQDTNDFQEILVSLLAKGNVYMVGDVKQSIYRFRNANPEIFKAKYRAFKAGKEGLAIDLSRNFRSRREVLEDVNLIFRQVMDSDLGGVDYDEGQRLIFGNKDYEKNAPEEDYRMRVINYGYENEVLKNYEIEAFLIAQDIRRLLDSGYRVYDKDAKTVRKARYSDFTILASEKKHFDTYKKIFEYLEIPLLIHKEESFVRSQEIYVLKNILRCIQSFMDETYRDENFRDALLSLLRSFLVEGKDGEIFKVLSGEPLAGLKSLFPEVFSALCDLSTKARKSTLSEILWEIYDCFGFYEKMIKIGNLEEVEEKLNFLLGKFRELDRLGFRLRDAIAYLEEIMDGSWDIEFSRNPPTDADAVQMMTIHKAKGLEFPVCYFPDLDSNFKFTELNDRIVFDPEYGFLIPYFKEGVADTFYKKLLKHKFVQEEISERIRVLYVALTRAKEQIVIVAPEFLESHRTTAGLVPYADRLNYKSFFTLLSSVQESFRRRELASVAGLSRDYETGKALKIKDFPQREPLEIVKVSLRREKSEKGTATQAATGLLPKATLDALELGTTLHAILEVVDFREKPEAVLEKAPLSPFLKERLLRLFQEPLFRKPIIKTYHEFPFYFEGVRGTIDLILETEAELIVLDYKLSNLEKEEYLRQLGVYKAYLETISGKTVSAYLYSLLKGEIRRIF